MTRPVTLLVHRLSGQFQPPDPLVAAASIDHHAKGGVVWLPVEATAVLPQPRPPRVAGVLAADRTMLVPVIDVDGEQ
jgi:hypothetical protein